MGTWIGSSTRTLMERGNMLKVDEAQATAKWKTGMGNRNGHKGYIRKES